MNQKTLFFTFLILFSFIEISAQTNSISEINSFIKKNSTGSQNFWAYLRIKDGNLFIYNNTRTNLNKYRFPIDKIDYSKIKYSKKNISLKANTPGDYVSFSFITERKKSVAYISIFGMNKSNKQKLTKMISNLIKEQQNSKSKVNIRGDKLNKVFWDFFLNYELSNKNNNLSTIYNYIPNSNKDIKQIILTSNLAHNNENITFQYNEEDKLIEIKYTIERSKGRFIYFNYTLVYDKDFLKSILIKGKEKYHFYYSGDLLESVTMNYKGAKNIYNIKYNSTNNKAYLNLNIESDKKLYNFVNKNTKGTAKDFINWNENYQIQNYELGRYIADNIKYDEKGNVLSFNFGTTNSDSNALNWQYTFDQKGNFITQKNEKVLVKRNISYK